MNILQEKVNGMELKGISGLAGMGFRRLERGKLPLSISTCERRWCEGQE